MQGRKGARADGRPIALAPTTIARALTPGNCDGVDGIPDAKPLGARGVIQILGT